MADKFSSIFLISTRDKHISFWIQGEGVRETRYCVYTHSTKLGKHYVCEQKELREVCEKLYPSLAIQHMASKQKSTFQHTYIYI